MKTSYRVQSGPLNTKGGRRYEHLGGLNSGEQGSGYTDAHLTTDLIYTASGLLGALKNTHASQAQAILSNNGTANSKSIQEATNYIKTHMGHDLKALKAADLLESSLQVHNHGTQNEVSNGAIRVGGTDTWAYSSYYNKVNSYQHPGERDPLTGSIIGLGIAEINDVRSN